MLCPLEIPGAAALVATKEQNAVGGPALPLQETEMKEKKVGGWEAVDYWRPVRRSGTDE